MRRVWLTAAFLLVVVGLSVLAALDVPPTARFWANLNWTITCLGAFVMGVVGTVEAPPADRPARALFAVGVGLYGLGQVIWDAQLVAGVAGEPAISDIAYLGAALPFAAGLVRVAGSIERPRRAALALDVCVVAVSVVVAVLAMFGRQAFGPNQAPLASVVILAYPITFVSLAGALLVLAIASSAYPRPSSTLLIGLAVTGVYWFAWAPTAVGTLPSSAVPINHLFTLGVVLLGIGTATWRTMPVQTGREAGQTAVTLVPVAALVAAIGSTFIGESPALEPTGLARMAGVVGLVLVLGRQTLLLRDRERAHADLEVAQERLSSVLDHLPGVAWTTDASLRVTSLRGGAMADLGLDGLDDPMQAVERVISADDAARLREAHDHALAGLAATVEVTVANRALVVHVAPLGSRSRRPIGVVSVGLDVTAERQALVQLAEAARLESLGRLAGGIAHDFNNLLTAINGYAEIAADSLDPSSPIRGDIDQIREAGLRASELTRQILAFARRTPTQPEVIDLRALVRGLQPLLGRLVGEDVRLEVELPDRALPVLADRAQAEQIVVNLVVNAREAMPKGGRLTIRGNRAGVEGGEEAELIVRDSGVGMDETTKAHVFEPFFTTKRSGTGLGLAIVYGAVQAAGGRIEVESGPGAGSEFRIRLPLLADAGALEGSAAPGGRSDHRAAPARILVVDDSNQVRALTAAILRRAGHDVVEAAGADAAVGSAGTGSRFDLLVTDLVMPDVSGIELIGRLRSRQPELAAVVISGYADGVLARDPMPDRAWLVGKPFTREQLLDAVDAALRGPEGPATG